MDTKTTILSMMHAVAKEGQKTLVESLDEHTRLLECGLDSLDFAILVARLERELGEDPFAALETPIYPQTLGEFYAIYVNHFNAKS